MISQRALDAIEYSDTDELLRVIDGYSETEAWDGMVELRTRCREAVTRGKQLWGVEEHIRYRLALEAPPRWAGPAVSEGVARFALGPLAEVAASTKTWVEMEPFLPEGPERRTFAAERVVRGDTNVEAMTDLPEALFDWEPKYQVATYKADKLEAPSPPLPAVSEVELPSQVFRIHDSGSEGALADLVEAWTDESNGRCQTAAIEGSALGAISALGLTRARADEIDDATAMGWVAWAAASGGAHGRRRGAAAGRFSLWWLIAMLGDLDWPADPEAVELAQSGLGWVWFDDGAPPTGWGLRLAIEDRSSGLAWAISALDWAD